MVTSSVAMVIPGHGLKCHNRIAANIMENPYSIFKLFFLMKELVFHVNFIA